jgi:Gamma tubulin complex component N-terminal
MTGLKGGALVDKIHSFTAHGDPYVRAFAHKLLMQITRPWYEMLKTWIYEGQLRDPFQEFFVRETAVPAPKSRYDGYGNYTTPPSKTSAWEGKYSLEDSLVPGFIGEQVARKVFLIGKSLNFIRGDCGEEGYVVSFAKEASIEGPQSMVINDRVIIWKYSRVGTKYRQSISNNNLQTRRTNEIEIRILGTFTSIQEIHSPRSRRFHSSINGEYRVPPLRKTNVVTLSIVPRIPYIGIISRQH